MSCEMAFDPWSSDTNSPTPLATSSFEDNFIPVVRLPDSAEYLESLERKLTLLKRNRKGQKQDILEGLEEKRQDVVVRLLVEDNVPSEAYADEDIPTKWLKNYINPEQPLTVRMSLWNKKTFCLVTGASQGIGREIALQFAGHIAPGSCLVLSARSQAGLNQTAELIAKTQSQLNIKLFLYDMSQPNPEDFKTFLSDFKSEEYDLYLLVHNAGSEGSGRFILECDQPQEWQTYMNLNLYSMISLTSTWLKTFPLAKDRTAVVNITSLAGLQAFPGLGEYSIGKCAREMYMKVLAAEQPHLKLLNYSPGPVKTEMIDRCISKVSDKDSKEMFDKMRREETLVKAEDTVAKLVGLLSVGLPPLSRVDYFDR